MIDLIFNNKSLRYDLGVSIVKRPPCENPEKNIRVDEVPGRDGSLYTDLGGYKDIVLPVECNFLCPLGEIRSKYRLIKSWINNINDNKLIFTDDPEWYYKVVDIKLSTLEVVMKRKGHFTINFTCRAYQYAIDGNDYIELENGVILFNEYSEAKPFFKVIGNGPIEITINNNTFKAIVSDLIYIDSELEVVYRETDNPFNLDEGEYPVLYQGENTITYKGNITEILIKPNWRCN